MILTFTSQIFSMSFVRANSFPAEPNSICNLSKSFLVLAPFTNPHHVFVFILRELLFANSQSNSQLEDYYLFDIMSSGWWCVRCHRLFHSVSSLSQHIDTSQKHAKRLNSTTTTNSVTAMPSSEIVCPHLLQICSRYKVVNRLPLASRTTFQPTWSDLTTSLI
jgi:hypothetical protein